MDLKGKVAIITGATSGIGAAVARNLDEAGVKLVLTGRREDRLAALCGELGCAASLAGDLADASVPQALMNKAQEEYGRCDIVLNNAGVMEVGPIEKIDIDRVCHMARVNVEAAYRMAYTALKMFVAQGSGHLINVSSILGTKTRPTAGAYAGTKYAIEALSESLRMEVARTDVAVSCIEPGLVQTELQDHWEVHPTKALDIPNPLQPEDIARCVRFVLEQPKHVRIPRMLVTPQEQAM